MITINAEGLDHKSLNERIRAYEVSVSVTGCIGQRFIAAGLEGSNIKITGTPGNALGAYLNGGSITVYGNAQDAVGVIIVLGHGAGSRSIVGNFPCTGMHGGRMFLRADCKNIRFPESVTATPASASDMADIDGYLSEYCSLFGVNKSGILDTPFTKIVPNSKSPYKQMYVAN